MAKRNEQKIRYTRPPYERMMYIHEQVKNSAFPNCAAVAKHFETSRRTILRDIQFMGIGMGLPIEYDKQKHGFYYSKPVEDFPGVTLSESELFAILVAQKAIANYKGTSFHKPLVTAFHRIAGQLGKDAVLHLHDLGEAMDIRLAGPESLDEEIFEIVLRAVQQRRLLEFDYRKQAAKEFEKRRLHPYQLVCSNNRWYVLGQDLARNDIRTFVLSRMAGPEILPGGFQRPANFNVKNVLKGSFGIFKGKDDFEVVLELDNWAADILRNRRWHWSQKVIDMPGGEMRVSFNLDNLEEIEQWVLGWGAHAKVIRPQALADRAKASAQKIVQRYAESETSKDQASPGQDELFRKRR